MVELSLNPAMAGSLAALVIPGDEPNEASEEAKKIFHRLNVEIVSKDEVSDWADTMAERILHSTNV